MDDAAGAAPTGPRVWRVDGSRAAVELATRVVRGHVERVRAEPSLLARPLRIVVPGRAARLGLAAHLAASIGHSVAGVALTTLDGLALACLARAGERPPRGERLAGLLVERLAEGESELRASLGDLEGGLAAARRSVADLLAAGFRPEHAAPLLERLNDDEAPAGTRAERARAAALVRVAAEAEARREALGAGGRPAALARAADLLRAGRVGDLGETLVLALGEERGVALDLVEALAARGATVVLEEPVLPGAGTRLESPPSERFGPPSPPPAEFDPGPSPATLEHRVACDPDAEALDAAAVARAAVAAGLAPESIAIVARDAAARGPRLGAHLARLGLPWTLEAGGRPLDPSAHALRALLAVASDPARATVSRFLDALDADAFLARAGFAASREVFGDLRTGLATLGLARLRALAELDVGARLGRRSELPLPLRRGLEDDEADDESLAAGDERPPGATRAPRRRVAASLLSAAADAARELLALVADDATRETPDHRARLVRAADVLAWSPEHPSRRALLEVTEDLAAELPPRFELRPTEWLELVASTVEGRCRARLGGGGGGVQVLSAPGARGLSFALVILVGVERGAFPRAPIEDPLLPDGVRSRLAEVLPDLATSRTRLDGETRLFASLLAAAPRVVVSRARCDDNSKIRVASPLLTRLDGALPEAVTVGPVHTAAPLAGLPRPALDHLVRAGLAGDRDGFEPLAALALAEESERAEPSPEQRAVAAARAAILREVDTPGAAPGGARLAPWHGVVGAPGARDPRRAPLYATRLEDVAGCGWQAFLRRLLRLEPVGDPLEALPSVDARLLGILVHDVLEQWVERERARQRPEGPRPRTLDEALAAGAFAVACPPTAELERLTVERARELARREGLAHPGLVRVLVEQAAPMLQLARRLEWAGDGPLATLGAELEGALTARDSAGAEWSILFRADRADLDGSDLDVDGSDVDGSDVDGSSRPRLTDYKSGAPFSKAKTAATRARHLLADVARGERLQAAAYALGAQGEGRYLFLRAPADAWPTDARELTLAADDEALEPAFTAATARVLDALREGAFPPRLFDAAGDEPPRCGYCEVAEACVRGDSGARGRIAAYLERLAGVGPDGEHTPLDDAWSALWNLATAAPERAT